MKTKPLILSAIFAAIIFVNIMFFHIPNGMGGVIHFGDSLIFLAAAILPFPYAMFVAGLGAGLFNLVRVPIWLPFTIVIKPLMTLCFTSKSDTILGSKRNMIAPFFGVTINTVLYFFANWFLFDQYTAVGAFPALLIQGAGSFIFFYILAYALDRVGVKNILKRRGFYDNNL